MSQGSFLETLKGYLQKLAEPAPPQEEIDPAVADPVWARSLLLRTLERVDQGETGKQYYATASSPAPGRRSAGRASPSAFPSRGLASPRAVRSRADERVRPHPGGGRPQAHG